MRKNVRAIILAILLFASFLSWACVIRHASHLGYMLGTLGYIDKRVFEDHDSDKLAGYTAVSVGDSEMAKSEGNSTRKEKRVARYNQDQIYMKKKASVIVKQMLVYFR
jgi:hypothetical protein